jgi:hypothetical protein
MKYKTSSLFLLSLILFFGCGTEEEAVITVLEPGHVLNIVVEEEITANQKIDFTLLEGDNTYTGKIKRRGGFSSIFPKHSFTIDLQGDHPLLDLPSDDDWIFNANYIDKTFLRHVVSYEIFSDMNANNLVSKSEYTAVEINGDYNGFYVLMERLDKSSLYINGDDSSAMIFKEPHIFRESYAGITPQEADNFHQQTYPDIDDEDMSIVIEDLRSLILDSSDELFTSELPKQIDLANFIDWHLLLLISNNSDGILKNFYLYKQDADTPIRIAPWDYDHSFGRDGDNELNLDEHPLDITRSILFKRLLTFEWYKTQLKERWTQYNEVGLLSVQGLKNRFSDKIDQIRPHVSKNFELWEPDAEWYYDSNDFDQEVDIIFEFIDLRHSRISEYFDEF